MRNWTLEDVLATGRDAEGRLRPASVARPADVPIHLSSATRAKLHSEQRLQVKICAAVRPRLVPGAKFCATNIELPGGSKLFALFQQIRTAMGAEAGFPDAIVLWPVGRVGFVEVKRGRGEPDLLGYRTARGELSGAQRAFRDWCREWGYPWCSPRSVEEALEVLLEWGVLRAP